MDFMVKQFCFSTDQQNDHFEERPPWERKTIHAQAGKISTARLFR